MAKDKAVTPAEAKQKKGEMLVLLSFLVGAIGLVVLMGLISSFLSNNAENRMPFLIGTGATAALTAALYITGRRIAHKA